MSAYPARSETAYGRAHRRLNEDPWCERNGADMAVPDDACGCDACNRYFDALDRKRMGQCKPE